MISFVNTRFESAPRDNGRRTFLLTENRSPVAALCKSDKPGLPLRPLVPGAEPQPVFGLTPLPGSSVYYAPWCSVGLRSPVLPSPCSKLESLCERCVLNDIS